VVPPAPMASPHRQSSWRPPAWSDPFE